MVPGVGTCINIPHGGGRAPLKNVDLPGFSMEHTHLLLQGVYGDFPHHNDGSHLDGVVLYNGVCQSRWNRLDAQSVSWYATPSGAVGYRFMSILA